MVRPQGPHAVDPGEVYDAQGLAGRGLLDGRRVLTGLRALAPYDGEPHFIYCFLMSGHIIGTRQPGFERWRPASSAGLRDLWAAPRGSVPPRVPTAEIVNFYDNGVLQAADVIREIFEILGDRGYLRDSVVVITGDHGEGLGEHGHFGHSRYPYQEDIHVPLLFYDPDPTVTETISSRRTSTSRL